MQKKNILNIKIFIFIIFTIFFLLGINLFQDYGISIDEKFHRTNALFWYKYIKIFLFDPNSLILNNLNELISLKIKDKDFIENTPSIQPLTLAIFYELFVDIFNLDSSRDIFQFRHLYNFIIYFLGLYFFYKLIFYRYKSYALSIVGILFLFLTPRMFAESFYNQKDIFFLSLTIVNMYSGIIFLKKPNFKSTLMFSLSSALAIDTRIMGLVSVLIILFLFFLKLLRSTEFLKKNLKFLIYFIPITFFLIIFFWPYLWADPINNFLFAFSELPSIAFKSTNLYMGEFILSTNIPWHYHLVWMGVTIPLIIILFFFVGLFFLLKRLINRLLNLDEYFKDIWRGHNEMSDIYFLLMFLFPIIIFIKKSLGYDGWRHLYFIYPAIIMISLSGLYYLNLILKNKILKGSILITILINFIYLGYWSYKFHPHQYVYFNLMFKKNFQNNFDMDYWGVSNKSSLEHIISNNIAYPIKIGSKSFVSLEKSSLILDDKDKSKISIIHNLNDADFIITNYRAKIKNNFFIDKNKYKKYYEVVIDNTPINTVYKKIK